MATKLNKRDIISRKKLLGEIEAFTKTHPKSQWRKALLNLTKTAFQKGADTIKHHHMIVGITGLEAARANAYLTDQIIRLLYDYTITFEYPLANPTKSERITIVATGGYGRGELAPFSDVDLLFLIVKKGTPWAENVSEYILYLLWDLGWKVGHAIRTAPECVRYGKEDITIRTALMESRYIWGDDDLFNQTQKLFYQKVIKGTGRYFVEAKLKERDKRHKKLGNTRYVVEPNLKDGKGGLRDLQTLWWIAKYLYNVSEPRDLISKGFLSEKEFRIFRKAENFLWTVRCSLHYMAGRAEERLTFDWQKQLAEQLQYKDRAGATSIERFMKHYFLVAKEVGDLTRIFCAVLETRQHKKPLLERFIPTKKIQGFQIENDRLTFIKENALENNPLDMLKLFHVSDTENIDIHPNAFRAIQKNLKHITTDFRADPKANALFLDILTSKNYAEKTLRRMNEAGLLGQFIPDFGRVVAQMQYDMYHHYTVDEHTIRAIGLLAAIEAGHLEKDHPLASIIIHKIKERRVLYMAVFLHDIAKGRKGSHSELGAQIAEKLCPQVGMTKKETEMVAWLVRYHLLMSHTAFKRDIADPKTIHDFVEKAQNLERLRLLVILTVVDIRAVGPNVWNGWKGQLLRDLYGAAEEVIKGGSNEINKEKLVKENTRALQNALKQKWPKKAINNHIKRFNDAYWLTEDHNSIVLNANLMLEAAKSKPLEDIEIAINMSHDKTHVSVYMQDTRGLFARVAGAIGIAGGNIVRAKIHTTNDGWAIDNFTLQGSNDPSFDLLKNSAQMKDLLKRVLKRDFTVTDRLNKRRILGQSKDNFNVATIISVDNQASSQSTVIEITALNRPGLLYDVTYALYKLNLSIYSAHVDTYGEKAVDVFYVRDDKNKKITAPARLKLLKETLSIAAGEISKT